MAITITQTSGVDPAGAVPSAPTRQREFDFTFAAGDTYPNPGGYAATFIAAFAAAFPGETICKGGCYISLSGATPRFFQVNPGTTPSITVFEENAGTLRQVPNGTDLSGHSPVRLKVTTQ